MAPHSASAPDVQQPDDTPGTTLLVDVQHNLQAEHTEVGDIILVPEPSRDPEDPLNWSSGRKYRTLGCALL